MWWLKSGPSDVHTLIPEPANVFRYTAKGTRRCDEVKNPEMGWKRPESPPMDEGVSKMGSIHTVGYYSALKRQDALTQATTCMNLEDVMLGDICQTQKDKYCVIPLLRGM